MVVNNKRFNLKVFREKHGLTQEEMAVKLQVSKSHYVNIERGVYDPSYEFLERFSKVFELDDIWHLFKKGV